MYFQALPSRQEIGQVFRGARIAELPFRIGRIVEQGNPSDAYLARCGYEPTHHAVEQRTLAAAVRTHEHKPVAGLNCNRYFLDHHTRPIPCSKATDLQMLPGHRRPFVVLWITLRLPPTATHALIIIKTAPRITD